MTGRAAWLIGAVLVAAACGPSASPTTTLRPTATVVPSPSPAPVSVTARDDLFVFTVMVPRLNYRAGEEVDIQGSVEYVGPDPEIVVRPRDVGLMWFAFEQLDGPLAMGPASYFICSEKTVTLKRHEPLIVQLPKAASWTSDDPAASFYESWASDPVLRLPAGRWQVDSGAEACDETGDIGHSLKPAPIILAVTP